MAGASLAERRDAHQRGDAHEKPWSVVVATERLITAPHVQVIHTQSPSIALSTSPQRRRDLPDAGPAVQPGP
jgi:hypothetical protein